VAVGHHHGEVRRGLALEDDEGARAVGEFHDAFEEGGREALGMALDAQTVGEVTLAGDREGTEGDKGSEKGNFHRDILFFIPD